MNHHMMYLAAVAWANGGTLRRAGLGGADLRGADLTDATLWGANLRGANLCGANLCGANLRDANLGGANLRDADLRDADLRGANLWRADLWDADLRGANLWRADLGGADLGGADLTDAKCGDDTLSCRIAAAERMDGYTFHLFLLEDGTHKVMAGCRWMTVGEYRAHVAAEYPGTDKARETLGILDYFERRAA